MNARLGHGRAAGWSRTAAPVLAALSLCAASAAWAQSPKLAGGVGFGWYGTDWGMTHQRLPGPIVGIGVEWGHGSLLCETDLQYIEKRNRYLSRAWDFTLGELSLPVLLKVRRGSRLRPYVTGGGEIALILSQRTADVSGVPMNGAPTATWDYGLVLGGGVEIKLGRAALEIEGRYHLGLADTTRFTNDGAYDFKTRVLVLLGGVRF